MNDSHSGKVNKLIATGLLLIQMMTALPGQELSVEREAGRARLEQYLDRAERERDGKDWQRVAEEGIFAAMSEWESANVKLHELDEDTYIEEKERAEESFRDGARNGYIEWAVRQVYGKGFEGLTDAEGELKGLSSRWTYENAEDDEKERIVKAEEGEAAKAQWEKEASEVVRKYEEAARMSAAGMKGELEERLAGAKLSSEEIERLRLEGEAAYVKYAGMEARRLAEAEGNVLLMQVLYDQESLKKKSETEAARVLAAELAEEAKDRSGKALDELFDRLETGIEAGEGEGIEISFEGWLESFRRAFDESVGKWEEAELEFLKGRAEWEREAGILLSEGEEVWAEAYGKLEEKRREWEKEITKKFSAGLETWQRGREGLEREIEGARTEFEAVLEKGRREKEKLVDVQITIYNQSRAMEEMAMEGIQGWFERWGEKYRESYYYWKTEEKQDEGGIYGKGEGCARELADAGLEMASEQIKNWQNGYIKNLISKTEQAAEKWKRELDRLRAELTSAEERIATLAPYISAPNIFTDTFKKAHAEAVVLAEQNRQKIDEAEKTIQAYTTFASRLKSIEATIDVTDVMTILVTKDARTIGEELSSYYKAMKAETGEISGRDGVTFDADMWKSGEELVSAESGWLALAVRYRQGQEKALEDLLKLTGSAAAGEGYYDELDAEILKAKAVVKYWEEELEVAREVNAYAETRDSSAEGAQETQELLVRAGEEYERRVAEYGKAAGEIEEAYRGTQSAAEAVRKAEEALEAKRAEVETAREKYGTVLLALKGVESESLKRKITALLVQLNERKGNGGESEASAALESYYERAREYGSAVWTNQIYQMESELVNGTGMTYSVTELRERAGSWKKAGLVELEAYLHSIRNERAAEYTIVERELEVWRGAGSAEERKRSEELISEAFRSVETYWRNEAEKREESVSYLRGGNPWEGTEELSGEDEKAGRVRIWIEVQIEGVEKWKRETGFDREGRWDETLAELKGLASLEGEAFIGKAEELRKGSAVAAGLLRKENVWGESGLYEWLVLEAGVREREAYGRSERRKEIEGTYEGVRREVLNRANAEATAAVRDASRKKSADEIRGETELYKWIEGLRKAGAGLASAGSEALERYISGVIAYKAAEEVYQRKIRSEAEWQAESQKLRAVYEAEVRQAEGYAKYQYALGNLKDLSAVFADTGYAELDEGVQGKVEEYASALVLGQLTALDLEEVKAGADIERVIEEKLKAMSGEEAEKSWQKAYLGIAAETRKQISALAAGKWREGEAEYRRFEKYREVLEAEKRYTVDGNSLAYNSVLLKYAGDEDIERYLEARTFTTGYDEYLRVMEAVSGMSDGELEKLLAGKGDAGEEGVEATEVPEKTDEWREGAIRDIQELYSQSYAESLSEQEREWKERLEKEGIGVGELETYAYYLGGDGMLYMYIFSGRSGGREAEAAARLEDGKLKEEALSYLRKKEAAMSWSGLLDGDAGQWLETWTDESGRLLSREEREEIYEALTYGTGIGNIYDWKAERASLAAGGRAGDVQRFTLRGEVTALARKLAESASELIRRLGSEWEYARAVVSEYGNKSIEWMQETAKLELEKREGLTEKETEAVAAYAVNRDTAIGKRVDELKAAAARHLEQLTGGDGSDSAEGRDAYGEYKGKTEGIEGYLKAMQSEMSKYSSLVSTADIETELVKLSGTIGLVSGERTAIEKKAGELKAGIEEAERGYREEEAKWKAAAEAESVAIGIYNGKVDEAEELYEEVRQAQIEKRKAQEKYEWATGVYVENAGGGEGAYRSPKEREAEAEYSLKRAETGLKVLNELQSGKREAGDGEYNEALELYEKRVREYYIVRIAVWETAGVIGKQENAVREAEAEAEYFRQALVKKYESDAPGGEGAEKGEKKLSDVMELVRIYEVDGEYRIELGYSAAYKQTGEVDSGTIGGSLVSKYEHVTEKVCAEELSEETLRKYLEEESVTEETVDGQRRYTAAEAEGLEWLERMGKKGEAYYGDVMLASLYLRMSGGEAGWLEGCTDVREKGEYSLGDVPVSGLFHDVDIGQLYEIARMRVLMEAYGRVKGSREGREDVARYLIYRETTLVESMKGREKGEVEKRAIEKVVGELEGKERGYEVAGAISMGVSAAFAVVAAFFSPWLLIPAAAAMVIGIWNFDRASSVGEAKSDVGKVLSGKSENLAVMKRGSAGALSAWMEAEGKRREEREKLDELYYGKGSVRNAGSAERGGNITYESFVSAMEGGRKSYGEKVSEAELSDICSLENFEASGAGEEGKANKALERIEKYLEEKKEEAGVELEKERSRLERAQREAGSVYESIRDRGEKISGEERKVLGEYARKASDVTLSVEERKRSGELYDEYLAKITESTEEMERELRGAAEKAWGEGTVNQKGQDMRLIELEESILGTRVSAGEGTEEYTLESEETYKESVIEAYKNSARVRAEVKEKEWALELAGYDNEMRMWEEQIGKIEETAAEEWEKAEGRVRSEYRQWREEFEKQYAEKCVEWQGKYGGFLEAKQGWIEEQYVYAANVRNGGAIEASGVDVGEVIAGVMKEVTVRGGLEAAGIDAEEYTNKLVGESGLGALMRAAVNLEEAAKYGGRTVKKGYEKQGNSGSDIARAQSVMRELREQMEEAAGRLAAEQARAVAEKTREKYLERIEGENRGMREWEESLVRESGYSVGGEIYREAVVDASVMNAERKRQTVHIYEDFRTSVPETGGRLEGGAIEGLRGSMVMLVVDEMGGELEKWGERIFGRIEKDGKGREGTKSWRIPRRLADAREAAEYGSANEAEKKRLEVLAKYEGREYESLSDREKEEYGELTREFVSVRDGELGEHIGYAGTFTEKPDMTKSREANVERAGRGEMGLIMLDFEWNSMEMRNGYSELSKPGYDKKLWRAEGSLVEPPTLRGICDMAMTIVGNAIGGGVGGMLLGFVDDLLFAGLDVTGGYRDIADVAQELGKKALTAAISLGAGKLGDIAGDAAAKALAGAGKAMNFGAQAAIGAATNYLGGIAGNYVNAYDFKSGTMDWEKGNAGWTDARTIAGAAGSGISAGLGGLNLRDGNGIRLNGETFNVGGIQSLNNLAGGLATSAVSFEMTGNATFNLASFNGVGLFELTVGTDGVSSRIGMGGTSVSVETLMSAAGGARESRKVGEWKYGGEEKGSTLNAINMLGYTGNELDVGMSRDVWSGKLGVEYKEMSETEGTRQYGEYTKGNGKIVLNKDLLGGGLEGSAKLASVMGHEGTHVYGNRVEAEAHKHALETYGKLTQVFGIEKDKSFGGQMLLGILDGRNQTENMGEKDLWQLLYDGTLVNDNKGYLTDVNGNPILDAAGNQIGGNGIETGLLNILAGTSGKAYGEFTEEEIQATQGFMISAGMEFKEGEGGDIKKRTWTGNKTGQKLDMEEVMKTAGNSVTDRVFENYYNNTIDSHLANLWGADILFNKYNPIPEDVMDRYLELGAKHAAELLNAEGLENKYTFTMKNKEGEDVKLLKISENNPIISDIYKQYDSVFSSLQYMNDYGCNMMASIAYVQMLTGELFSDEQIKKIWNEAGKDNDILNITSNVNSGRGTVVNPDKLTDIAFKMLKRDDLALSFGYSTRYNTIPVSIGFKLKLPYSSTGHFVSGDLSSGIIYNPGRTTGNHLRKDEVFVYVK